MKQKKIPVAITLILTIVCSLFPGTPPVFPEKKRLPYNKYPAKPTPLPNGYKQYKFGSDRLTILAQVRKDPRLKAYDADFIIGFEQENWTVLVTVGPPFFKNIFFLFYKKKLFAVMIAFNREKYSYREVMHSLSQKYGQPKTLGLDVTIWQDKKVRLQLEQSVHLKYLDLVQFKKMQKGFDPTILKKKINKFDVLKNL